MDDLEPE
jgi:mRNA m6A methyltransferase catalytic subunit